MTSPSQALSFTILSGLIGGSTLMPMKHVRGWKWENSWLGYSVVAYFLFPLCLAALTVPNLPAVYADAGTRTVALIALLGLGWGTGVVLYGLALDIVGLSLTSSIILGCSVAIGSLVPLMVLAPGLIRTTFGLQILFADCLMLAGVVACAKAGGMRERAIASCEDSGATRPRDHRFFRGLLLCFLSGFTAPLLNLALTFGAGMIRSAIAHGAAETLAPNAVWGITVGMGALPSFALCVLRLNTNHTWRSFHAQTAARNWTLCLTMGACFIGSTVLYGIGAGLLGRLGPALGWPVYMSAIILANNFWGWYTGEWKGVRGMPVLTMVCGIVVQIVAIALLGRVH